MLMDYLFRHICPKFCRFFKFFSKQTLLEFEGRFDWAFSSVKIGKIDIFLKLGMVSCFVSISGSLIALFLMDIMKI
jgi:hypothetical protein